MRQLPHFPFIPKGSTPNCYRPHYSGRRDIAAVRNKLKIQSGKIPRDQVFRANHD